LRQRLREGVKTTNKAVLAAIAAGLLATITTGTVWFIRQVQEHFTKPITVAGGRMVNLGNGTRIAATLGCDASDGDYYVPYDETALSPPTAASGRDALDRSGVRWVKDHHATDANRTFREFVIQGKSGETVVIRAIHVLVLSRQGAPESGTHVSLQTGCGAGPHPFQVSVNLDMLTPIAQIQGGDASNPQPLKTIDYVVTESSPDIIDLAATTQTSDVTWELQLDYASGGRSGTTTLDDGGHPFHTTATAPEAKITYYLDPVKGTWEPLSRVVDWNS